MKSIEIYYSDLTEEKKEELKKEGFYHENIALTPLAIIDYEESEEDLNYEKEK